jgi:hypothetical protein
MCTAIHYNMRPAKLTPDQAAAFQDRVRPMLSFLHQTRRRLERLDLVQNSEIFRAVDEAHRAMHGLHVTLIYLAAGHGVWKAGENPGPTAATDQDQPSPNRPDD